MNYFGIEKQGELVILGDFESFDEAESAAHDWGDHESEDIVYFGTQTHFNNMFIMLETLGNKK